MAVRGAMMTWVWGCTAMGPLISTEAGAMEAEAMVAEATEAEAMEAGAMVAEAMVVVAMEVEAMVARHPGTESGISRCGGSDLSV